MPLQLANQDPNFSIVVPGPCNARCAFCFWKPTDSGTTKQEYLRLLANTLIHLPPMFRQCSITGGEPTASAYLLDILKLARQRFEKVVLSTNGFDLKPEHLQYIDHLNISRHDVTDSGNTNVFKTDSVPDTLELVNICHMAHKAGVDVTLNCVVRDSTPLSFYESYCDFAKLLQADAVCFRKEHGDLNDLPVENVINVTAPVLKEGGCPVCRTKTRNYRGINTTWRYGVLEPSQVINDIYELVFQQDGILTFDWKGEKPILMPSVLGRLDPSWAPTPPLPPPLQSNFSITPANSSGGGCHIGNHC